MRRDDEPFELRESERLSALWQRLEAHYRERLAMLRRKNDGNLTPDATRHLRGQIAEVKRFLALGEPPDPIEVDDQ